MRAQRLESRSGSKIVTADLYHFSRRTEPAQVMFHKPTHQVGLVITVSVTRDQTYTVIKTAQTNVVADAADNFMPATRSEIDEYRRASALIAPCVVGN
jgi:hypothetical protein